MKLIKLDTHYVTVKMIPSLSHTNALHHDHIQGVIVIRNCFPTSQANVEFGSGYNTVKLQRTFNNAVEVDLNDTKGSIISCHYLMKLCQSKEEFHSSFSGGISTSAGYMGVEGSASSTVFSEMNITSLDSMLVISVDVTTTTEEVTNVRLKEEPAALLKEEKMFEFVEVYGTHYLGKIIKGGRMVLVMKFSSESVEKKEELDALLKLSAGAFGSEVDFKANMENIKEYSSFEVHLCTNGSTMEPPKPEIDACMEYAIGFKKSVAASPSVRELDYIALWTIPGAVPLSFYLYLVPLQAKTDQIVGISRCLQEVHSTITGMLEQRDSDLSFFTSSAWEKLTELSKQVESLRTDLQMKFKTTLISELSAIINEFSGKGDLIADEVDKIAAQERILGDSFILQSYGTGKYISTEVESYLATCIVSQRGNGYPRLDSRDPVALKFEVISDKETIKSEKVTLGATVLIRSMRNSKILSMGMASKFVFWANPTLGSEKRCQWRLAHATNVGKVALEYGDRVVLYNRYWPNYIMGVSKDERWIKDIQARESDSSSHYWVLKRGN